MKISSAIAVVITSILLFVGYYIYSTHGTENMFLYVTGLIVLAVFLRGLLTIFRSL